MKTLVYGLNTDYRNHKEWIEDNFNICGYYDSDKTRIPPGKGIDLESNPELIHEFDQILVSADPVSIVADLKELYHVPIEKIRILFYELLKNKTGIQQFYSSFYEDAVLMLLVNLLGMNISGIRYLEIGTNDPVRFNNTFSFYQKGSRGVLVDPLPSVGDLVSMIRPEDKFINAAVSDLGSGENVSFYACKSSTVSSLLEEHHEKWNGMSHNSTREISVPLVGINDIFEMAECNPNIFLVDAEGFDEKIVKGVDYDKHRPDIIMFEYGHISETEESMDVFLNRKGYMLYTKVDANSIYVDEKYAGVFKS